MANSAGRQLRIRPAIAADRWAIRGLIYAAHLNPRDLDWRRFLVAEVGGTLVGTIQVRRHPDGTCELASLAVRPALHGAGIGAALIGALREHEPAPLYLYCRSSLAGYYTRFGFLPVPVRALPPSLRRIGRIAHAVAALSRQLPIAVPRLIFMRAESGTRA
jgi:N-acetylglutamate synthase-like GNAT family acetyltransferase